MTDYAVHALTPARWSDLDRLFGPRGACANCWCMYWRQRGAEWSQRTGAGNKAALRAVVRRGPPPGLLAYDGGDPVAWCQAGPRERFARILASRVRQPLDDTPSWVISCFFVAKSHRGKGLMPALIEAAVAWAREHGARRVEGFPVGSDKRIADTFAYVGTPAAFRHAGFRKLTRTVGTTRSTRYVLDLPT